MNRRSLDRKFPTWKIQDLHMSDSFSPEYRGYEREHLKEEEWEMDHGELEMSDQGVKILFSR